MYWFYQNLAKQKLSKYWFDRRGTISLDCDHSSPAFKWEICSNLDIRFGISTSREEREHSLNLGLIFFSIYLSIHNILPDSFYPKYRKSLELYIHSWSIWLCLPVWLGDFYKANETYMFSIPDFFLGCQEHEREVFDVEDTYIVFPEKMYQIKVESIIVKLKRPKWFMKSFCVIDIDCKEGIPTPGKGENSWDCGDSSTYSFYCPAKTVSEGISKLYESIKRRRERYGEGINMYVNNPHDYEKGHKAGIQETQEQRKVRDENNIKV